MVRHRPAWQICLTALSLALILISCNNQTPTPAPTALPIGPTSIATIGSSIGNPTAGLSAEVHDTVIKLTWQSMSGAAGYFVYRDGNEKPLNPKPIAETVYEDIGLTNGRSYTYTVAAADAAGQPGPQSAPITAIPTSH
jgi:hypothetical protein